MGTNRQIGIGKTDLAIGIWVRAAQFTIDTGREGDGKFIGWNIGVVDLSLKYDEFTNATNGCRESTIVSTAACICWGLVTSKWIGIRLAISKDLIESASLSLLTPA